MIEITQIAMKIKLLSTLTQEQRQFVKGLACNKTSVLFKANEPCHTLGMVISGEVQIVIGTPNGKDIIYESLHAGDIFGLESIFSSAPTYRGDVIALGKSTLALIEKDKVVEFMSSNIEFLNEFLRMQSDKITELNATIKILDSDNCDERLLTYIELHGKQMKIKSIQYVANQIHVTREALSRCIKKLVEKGQITKNGNLIKLNK